MTKIIVLFFVIALLIPAAAQDDNELSCELEDVQQVAADMETQLAEVASVDDPFEALALIEDARNQLVIQESKCNGLYFEGSSEIVFGPVEVPEGIYRVSVTTASYFIMHTEVLDGSCGPDYLFNLFNTDEKEKMDQTIFESDGCTALFPISNIQSEYYVTFEKLK